MGSQVPPATRSIGGENLELVLPIISACASRLAVACLLLPLPWTSLLRLRRRSSSARNTSGGRQSRSERVALPRLWQGCPTSSAADRCADSAATRSAAPSFCTLSVKPSASPSRQDGGGAAGAEFSFHNAEATAAATCREAPPETTDVSKSIATVMPAWGASLHRRWRWPAA